MSRFKTLRNHLPFFEALRFYSKLKSGKGESLQLNKLKAPFSLRNNPYDYATFEEVLLREEYNIELDFTPLTIIDAGANIGLTAIYFANRFPQSRIVSLEPDTENFNLLTRNTKPYNNINPLKCGLWSHDTFLQVIDEGHGNNAFTVMETNEGSNGAIKAVSIPAIMKAQNWGSIDLLKIDIEGSEKVVFESNYESWLPLVKVLIIELHDRMVPGASTAVFKAINKYNFSFDIKGENLVFRNNNKV